MAFNVEIKARVHDLELLRTVATPLASQPPEIIQQRDVFYQSANGRLKLRIFKEGHGELIQYHRPDSEESKVSDYKIAPVADPMALHEVLDRAYGTLVVVEKVRELILVGQTRVHLDQVKGLGDFMELEVVLRDNQTTQEGQAIAAGLMEQLHIHEDDLISGAYADMLMRDGDQEQQAASEA